MQKEESDNKDLGIRKRGTSMCIDALPPNLTHYRNLAHSYSQLKRKGFLYFTHGNILCLFKHPIRFGVKLISVLAHRKEKAYDCLFFQFTEVAMYTDTIRKLIMLIVEFLYNLSLAQKAVTSIGMS
jgi:hypothetical protein